MGLSIFTTATNPYRRGDNAGDAYWCYTELADELVVVNGDPAKLAVHLGISITKQEIEKYNIINCSWPEEFSWEFIGKQFTIGYEACTKDWCIRMDLDMLFHEKDFGKIREALELYKDSPAISFYKWQFILPDRYNLKSRLILALNKKKFGDRLSLSGGGDLCQPQLDGKDLDLNEMPQAGVPIYNYEKILKTKRQIMDDQGRMERAWKRHFGEYQMSKDGTDEAAYEAWYKMQQGRFNKPSEHIKLEAHPKYIQDTIRNLKPEQFGYNGFGLIEERVYA